MGSDISNRDDLQLLQAFVNSRDVESGSDDFERPAALRAWLADRGRDAAVSASDAGWAREVREALRTVLLANNGGTADPAAVAVLEAAGARAPLRVSFGERAAARIEPAGSGIAGLVGELLATVARLQAEGLWPRLKACAAGDCHWAYFDASRNRSRTWCDMAVCGNRAKARSYRARNAGGEGPATPRS